MSEFQPFVMERMMSKFEQQVDYNLSESGVHPVKLRELLSDNPDQINHLLKSGHWPLYRYNPEKLSNNENPLKLDCKVPSIPIKDYMYNETRFKMLTKSKPDMAEELLALAQEDADKRWAKFKHLADMNHDNGKAKE